MTCREQAERLLAVGVSVLPLHGKGHGDKDPKAPVVSEWKSLQVQRMPLADVPQHWKNGEWIGLIAGNISGNVEALDFDLPDKHDPGFKPHMPPHWRAFGTICKEHGYMETLKRCVWCKTLSGGIHVVYRCEDARIGGSDKLARKRVKGKVVPLIETRGEGGYIAVFPSEGYEVINGSLDDIPTISAEEREFFLNACRSLNEWWVNRVEPEAGNREDSQRPGTDYNNRGPNIGELLVKAGWKPCYGHRKDWDNYTRPDKPGGISGGVTKDGCTFHVFSTSAHPFDGEKSYSKFAVYALLFHGGSWSAAAKDLFAQGYGTKGGAPRHGESHNGPTYETTEPITEADEDELWSVLEDIEEGVIDWLWESRIPLGALTLISGDPGEGKSSITHALIATYTSGGVLPTGERVEPCNVVLVSSEDSNEMVLRKRLRLLGADLSRVSVLASDKKDADGVPIFDVPISTEMVFRRVKKVGAKLLVIDPIVEFIGATINMNHGNEVRPYMRRLRGLSEVHHCATVLIAHNNKNTGGKALYRTVGSVDFPAACRSVFQVGCNPDDPEQKGFAHVKHNWSSKQETLGYRVDDEGLFGWTGITNLSAEDISQPAAPKADRIKVAECRDWLKDQLSSGPINSEIIKSMAKDCGFSRRAVDSARAAIGARAERRGGLASGGYWVWTLEPKSDYNPWEDS